MHSPKAPTIAPPIPAPPPPTVDTAMQNNQETQAIRKRRGAGASDLAGNNPPSPAMLGASAVLGQ
jgi:hypothetical protein